MRIIFLWLIIFFNLIPSALIAMNKHYLSDKNESPYNKKIKNTERFTALDVSQSEWSFAEDYFRKNPNESKIWMRDHDELWHSFIKMGPEIYVLARKKYLGSGAFGKVKEAESKDQRFTVKIIDLGWHDEDVADSEIQIGMELGYTKTFLKIDGKLYILNRFIDGQNLNKILKQHRNILSTNDLIKIAIKACSAVQDLHQQNIIHGDIKPSNFMQDNEGCIFVIDFGLSHVLPQGQNTITGKLLGDKNYLAPELNQDERFSFASDIYALGVTLLNKFGFKYYPRLNEVFLDMIEGDPEKRPTLDIVIQRLQSVSDDKIVFDKQLEITNDIHIKEEQKKYLINKLKTALGNDLKNANLHFSELRDFLKRDLSSEEAVDLLAHAIEYSDVQAFFSLLIYLRAVQAKDTDKDYLVICAAEHVKVDILRLLLERCKWKCSRPVAQLFLISVESGKHDVLSRWPKTVYAQIPLSDLLISAAIGGQFEIFRSTLKKMPTRDEETNELLGNALICATANNQYEIVNYLYSNEKNNIKYDDKVQALLESIKSELFHIFQGVFMHEEIIHENIGYILDRALKNKEVGLFKFIVVACPLSIKTEDLGSALLRVVDYKDNAFEHISQREQLDVIKFILQYDISSQDIALALKLAVQKDRLNCVAFLLQQKIDEKDLLDAKRIASDSILQLIKAVLQKKPNVEDLLFSNEQIEVESKLK